MRANQQTSYHIASAKKTGPEDRIEIANAETDNAAPKDTGLDCVQESIEILESSVLQESDEIASTSATIDLAEDSETRGKSVGHKSKKMHYAQKF